MSEISFPAEPQDNSRAAEKVRDFPATPGVYLMKDDAGRVIYVGKAKNLRARAGSYFLKAAAADSRTAQLVREIRDIDYLSAESEVDALLMEARLIKDILPKYNRDLRDDKTFFARASTACSSSRKARSRPCWARCARRWKRPPSSFASKRPPGSATRSACWRRSTGDPGKMEGLVALGPPYACTRFSWPFPASSAAPAPPAVRNAPC